MKKKLSLLFLGVIGLFLCTTTAAAAVYTDGDNTYVFSDYDISCVDKTVYDSIFILDDNSLVFSKGISLGFEDQGKLPEHLKKENYIKVVNGNCTGLSDENFLEIVNEELVFEYYLFDESTNSILKLSAPLTGFSIFVPTTDTSVVEGKQYAELMDGGLYVNVEEPTNENISTYYDILYYKNVESTTLDPNETYYTYEGVNTVKKVETPVASEIINYYVEYEMPTSEEMEEEYVSVYQTLDEAVIKRIKKDYDYIDVTIEAGKPYLVLYNENEEHVDVYSTDGEKLLDNVKGFTYLSNELNIIFEDANNDGDIDKSIVYNSDNKKIFELAQIPYLHELYNEDNYTLLSSELGLHELKEYKILEGNKQNYKDKEKDLTFRFSGEFALLDKVYLNNEELDSENYTAEEGSTIITLKKEYLNTLKDGSYKLKVTYNDGGESTATFTIGELPKVPETFDGISMYLVLGSLSLIGLISTSIILKKRNN